MTAAERQAKLAAIAASMNGPTAPAGSRLVSFSEVITKPANPTAITQTYAPTAATHAVPTAGDPGVAPTLYDAAHSNALRTQVNNVRADHDNTKQVLNQMIDIMQGQGLAA